MTALDHAAKQARRDLIGRAIIDHIQAQFYAGQLSAFSYGVEPGRTGKIFFSADGEILLNPLTDAIMDAIK